MTPLKIVSRSSIRFFMIIFVLFTHTRSMSSSSKVAKADLQTYIVYLQPLDQRDADVEAWHQSFLADAGEFDKRIIYSYKNIFSGFAAKLTEAEAEEMAAKPGFVRAMLDFSVPLMTTRSPEFLGLRPGVGLWDASNQGKGVIIGMIDDGVDFTHPSFSDDGLPPPPSRWKRSCAHGFLCNNKIVGARSFTSSESNSGHGTHTAAIAAGNIVKGANVLGQAAGTASGVAPLAHLAIYKVCDEFECVASSVLAGIDAAVGDGVDILSISMGDVTDSSLFYKDPIAIATFNAVQKGVFVSCAAGNSGPVGYSVRNAAPWILTVAASSIDRRLGATVRLDRGEEFVGESIYQPSNVSEEQLPLEFIQHISDRTNIKKRIVVIVLCDDIALGSGAAAMILWNSKVENNTISLDRQTLPSSQVSYISGLKILSYIKSTENPTAAIIFKGTMTGTSPAPMIADFSARGPNVESPAILKPDITGPGVNILAAHPLALSNHEAPFTINSGTSMAAPHLSGVVALIKSAHPQWSPAMIKSAIMTTSYAKDNSGEPIKDENLKSATFFAMGAGHVDPSKAMDPGLVFDISPTEYIALLCGLGYSDKEATIVAGRRINCSEAEAITQSQLNYLAVILSLSSDGAVVNRTVKNVGEGSSTYKAEVEMPIWLSVTVEPTELKFAKLDEMKTFTVTVTGDLPGEGELKWASGDGKHVVRVPIIVF